jgi:hypothetical protein
MRRPPLALFALPLVASIVSTSAVAQPSQSLSEPQVACDRAQLGALVARTSVLGLDGGFPPIVQSLLFGYSNRFGFYEGLVVGMPRYRPTAEPPVPGFGPGPEHQLAFHLDPSVRELLLNPERMPLAQVSMTREVSTSSLVGPESEFAVQVRLRPTLGPGDGPDAGDLVIDNLAAPAPAGEGFRPADTKPGRGLATAGLTEPCHTLRSDLDRRVSAILQRTLRVELFDLDRGLRYDTRIALFRRQAPGVYGADVHAVDPETGALLEGFLDLLLEAHADGAGNLRDGRLLVGSFDLPGNPRVEGTVSIVRPLFGGVDTAYEPVVSAPVSSPLSAVWDLPFDWADVLEGTVWNPGGDGAAACGHGTAEEIAATPRTERSTELLALSMGQGLTAEQATYDRLVRDLAAIRAEVPAVDGISMFPTTDAKSLFVTVADPETYEAIGRGDYHEWDCLNEWYELEFVQSIDPVQPPTSLSLEVQLEGLYALEPVAEDYAALAGIASASPLIFPPPGAPAGTLPSLCADEAEGGVFRYFFDVPSSGHLRTYYFTTSADGTVELVGIHDPFFPGTAPPWLPLVDECYAGLRYGLRG